LDGGGIVGGSGGGGWKRWERWWIHWRWGLFSVGCGFGGGRVGLMEVGAFNYLVIQDCLLFVFLLSWSDKRHELANL
jgi:hypothetical protein